MHYTYSATYEFDPAPPETVTGAFDAASHQKAASLAIRALKAQHPGRKPLSIVIVLELDR